VRAQDVQPGSVPEPIPVAPLPTHIESILEAARIAPSHDNTQPWRFMVRGETISFLVDAERDRTPAGAQGRTSRMSRIAVGAALECALLRAGRMGAVVHFEAPAPGALVTVTITQPKRAPEPDKALMRRATNRRAYDGRPIDDATFAWLAEATPVLEGARTSWFGRERVRVLGPIVAEGEELLFADASLREASLRAVHFDRRDREEVTQGLSVGSLELTTAERMNVDALRHTPQDRLAAMGAFRKMGARAQRLMESASGVCVISTKGAEPIDDVHVGRCLQRAWLALTRRSLAAQPMGAIPLLEGALELEAAGVPVADRERAVAVVQALRAAFPNLEHGSRIGVLLRFGWAPPPTALVRRLSLQDSLAQAPDA
jgi:nitroreductase